MFRRSRALAAALLIAVFVAPVGAQRTAQPQPAFKGFDEWVTATMAEWHVPGVAIGVIKDGKVVYAKGFGFRDVEGKKLVDTRTLMAIGSNSKSFTATLMAMLVDEKKLDWDKPIRTYLPDFELWDEFATKEMTGKDLVSHRSGLPRHDNLWYGRAFTREEMYHRLKYLEPTYSFRSRYQYQNLMFMTAGYLTEKITGKSWEQQIQDRIFTPLGMSQSGTSANDMPKSANAALPYTWRNDSLVRLPYRNIDPIAPAGSINSNIDDMMKYIQFRMDQGVANGQRLVSADAERQEQSPQMPSGGAPDYPELTYSSYGLGIGVSAYRGKKVLSHTGGIDGFISAMSWLPDEKIGVMVLSNLSGNNPVPTMIARTLYDRLMGVTPADWVARQRIADRESAARAERNRQSRESERVKGTTPSHPLQAYAGSFEHPGYGKATVSVAGPDLLLVIDSHRVVLKHFHYDVWEIQDLGNVVPFAGRVRFLTNNKGEVSQVAVPMESTVADIIFDRK